MTMARANWRAVCGSTLAMRGAVAQVQMPVVGADEGDGVGGFDGGHGGSRIANPAILPAAPVRRHAWPMPQASVDDPRQEIRARVPSAAASKKASLALSSTMRPRSMNTTRSATLRAKPISWVTTIMVMPSCARPTITSSTSPTISGSSAEVGSSNSIATGSIASARAIATRCCWPPESWAGNLSWCASQADPLQVFAGRWRRLRRASASAPSSGPGSGCRAPTGAGTARSSGTPCRCARAAPAGRCPARRPNAVDADRALLEGLEAVDGLDQGRLAGAGRPAHDHHVAARHPRAAIGEHLEAAVPLADLVDFDHRFVIC